MAQTKTLATGFSLLIFALANAPAAGQYNGIPQFRSYPAGPLYSGPPAPPNLSSAQAYSYRTRLRDGSSKPANFNGHYQMVLWGCGTNCTTGAVIDQVDGQVTFLPFSVCCHEGADANFRAVEFRRDSRLVVLTGMRNETPPDGVHFYEFNNGTFVNIKSIFPPTSSPIPMSTAPTPTVALSEPVRSGCSTIADPADRLACYDRASPPPPSAATLPAGAVVRTSQLPPPTTTVIESAPSADYGAADLKTMDEEYKANQARFMRTYKGKRFSARLPLYSVTESLFNKGTYRVAFGDGRISGAGCLIGTASDIDFIIGKNKGDMINVSGTIEDWSFGSLNLDQCVIRR